MYHKKNFCQADFSLDTGQFLCYIICVNNGTTNQRKGTTMRTTTGTYGGYTMSQIKAAWDKIAPKHDWRAMIQTSVVYNDLHLCQAACMFYTSTTLRPMEHHDLSLLSHDAPINVEAIGYRAGPAGA